MDALDRKLVEYTDNDKSFVVTAEYLLRLASKAKHLFESSQPQQKNRILRLLLANLTLNQKRLQLNLLQPLSVLSTDNKSQNWLRDWISALLQPCSMQASARGFEDRTSDLNPPRRVGRRSNQNQRAKTKPTLSSGPSLGSGDWIRTSDLVVNSHPLYR